MIKVCFCSCLRRRKICKRKLRKLVSSMPITRMYLRHKEKRLLMRRDAVTSKLKRKTSQANIGQRKHICELKCTK